MNGYVMAGSFLGTAVEFVGALTIVLAVAAVKGWRSAVAGIAAGIVLLAIIVGALGPLLLTYVPLDVMKVVLGVLLLLFGLRWLRKAILRYAGYKAIHDEGEAYQKELQRQRSSGTKQGFDAFGFVTVLNGVFLEGLEAVFIVLTMGLTAKALGSAVWGAVAAVVVVFLIGVTLRKPLQFVPENTMKFVVGIMLSSFGTLWVAEGAKAVWWHSDVSVLILMAVYLLFSYVAVQLMKRAKRVRAAAAQRSASV
ncbi:MAG: hypothetical protein K6T83_23835 [Alicyclobacillus sp.]|nr:hypothetical protein [Alicyclobacillus sp.]